MKLLALLICMVPTFAFAQTLVCQGEAKATLVNDGGVTKVTTKTLKLTVHDEPSKVSLTIDSGDGDPETYSGALDLTGRTDTSVNNGGDITKIHTKLKNKKLEFSMNSKEGGLALTTLICK